jgi:BlaI family transcriptional regulator, penicillinase repressor
MRISSAESQVMEALWRRSPLSTEEITTEVGPANGWALGTVRTLLHRLLKKQAIEGQRKGARYEYRPLVQRQQYVLTESQGLLDRLFEGKVTPLVAYFAEHQKLSDEDLKKLNDLLGELDRDRR